MNTAIITAAGSGKRFNSTIPKQFLELAGEPVLVHTIRKFEACESVDAIIVVLATETLDAFRDIIAGKGSAKPLKIVVGGESRAASVKAGLAVCDPASGVVAVHDGARPLVRPREIAETIAAAAEFGAACLTADVTDTIKVVERGEIAGTVDRKKLRRAMTPQAFRYEILKRAFEQEIDDSVTDECSLVERLGIPIRSVPGSSDNIKITFAEDLRLAEFYMQEMNR